jgi:hypothetical protein
MIVFDTIVEILLWQPAQFETSLCSDLMVSIMGKTDPDCGIKKSLLE